MGTLPAVLDAAGRQWRTVLVLALAGAVALRLLDWLAAQAAQHWIVPWLQGAASRNELIAISILFSLGSTLLAALPVALVASLWLRLTETVDSRSRFWSRFTWVLALKLALWLAAFALGLFDLSPARLDQASVMLLTVDVWPDPDSRPLLLLGSVIYTTAQIFLTAALLGNIVRARTILPNQHLRLRLVGTTALIVLFEALVQTGLWSLPWLQERGWLLTLSGSAVTLVFWMALLTAAACLLQGHPRSAKG